MPTLSADAARALMLAAQGLDRRPRRRATKADVRAAIRRMGALQIDTIHVVARSPFLVLWSRLGDYDPRWVEALLEEGALFEYWSHEASFLPIEHYPLYRHRMLDPASMGWKYAAAWMETNRADVERILAHVREHGPVRSADFERTDGGKAQWWGWKPEKRALESLTTAGELMIAKRVNFQRVYDLRERVLPGWSDDRALDPAAARRELALASVRALGIAKGKWVTDYFRLPKVPAKGLAEALAAEGLLLRVAVEGWKEPAYVHPDNAALLDEAVAGRLRPTLTTVLSPFDPLVWDRARASETFGFDYRLECYTPEPKRVYGYFTLPILRKGRLIGRLDPKAHRAAGIFEVKSIHFEPGVRLTDAVVADVARALREVASWHGTPEVVVRRGVPDGSAAALTAALAATG